MNYSFDIFGWLSDDVLPDRATTVEPPQHGAKEVGQPYPNWTGVEWVMAVYADPPAPAEEPIVPFPGPMSKLQFLSLLTDAEYVGILTAAKTVPQVEAWIKKFELAEDVRLDDPRTIAGMNGLEAATLLGVGRAARVLSGRAPL